ncbi:MAG: 3-phosphoshikimate 1-carboxyvinyltransferase [Planctomycetales bacterium]|nr:3-phosphoshikimate 1-carboxyvinyltransferase [Planctomycetales bacterium]
MPDSLSLTPCPPVRGSIRPPGSKSITNRALVCAALAEGISTLSGALDSEDTQVMIDSLHRLGIQVQRQEEGTRLIVSGCGGNLPSSEANLFVGNSGTTIRFLTALITLGRGTYRLDGVPRMHERPIADLISALNQLGADVRSEVGTGCPPVIVKANGLPGGTTTVRGDISSQFLSGLLMAAPLAQNNVELLVEGELVSQPYVTMTIGVMREFGVEAHYSGLSRFLIAGQQRYRGCEYAIEPDASAASYFWGLAAVTRGEVTVEGLGQRALQGDVAFVHCLEQMGCRVNYNSRGTTVSASTAPLRGIDVDMNAISDTAQTLAVVALFADGPTTIRGVAHIRHKETDRIGDLARELRKLGAKVDEFPDGLRITPAPLHGATIDTYNDHRMAMSFALAGMKIPGVTIQNPDCTAKTYPKFFEDLSQLVGNPKSA